MANQVDKIIAFAKGKLGSAAYDGYCQRFVRECYEAAGLYDSGSTPTATDAYKKWCIGKKKSDIPVGAAVYFTGTDSAVGHVAIYAGNGYIYNPASTVKYIKISAVSGFRGWGWQTGKMPDGAQISETASLLQNAVSQKTSSVKKDIEEAVIKSISGTDGKMKAYTETQNIFGVYYELYIQNGTNIFMPIVKDGITLEFTRSGRPSVLKFTVIKDGMIDFLEGNTVIFKVGGKGIFYGYVFTKQRNRQHHIEVTAYDQLRYFKNSDTYMYKNKKASELITMICQDFKLNTGTIADTGYVIESRIEDNQTLFDIMENAINLTFENTGARYIMYDDFGKICLVNTNDLKLDLLINAQTAQDFYYTTSVDNIYTQVQVYKDNSETGQREKYIAKNSDGISAYGVLQRTEKCDGSEEPSVRAENILGEFNGKTRKLTVDGAFGDIRVRGGSQIMVSLNLGDIIHNAYMMVDSVVHTFNKDSHTMKAVLIRNGEFIA